MSTTKLKADNLDHASIVRLRDTRNRLLTRAEKAEKLLEAYKVGIAEKNLEIAKIKAENAKLREALKEATKSLANVATFAGKYGSELYDVASIRSYANTRWSAAAEALQGGAK